MPRLIYRPEGTDPKIFDFKFERMVLPECIEIERAMGPGFDYYADAERLFFAGNAALWFALLYVLLKREQPTLRRESLASIHAGMLDADFADDEYAGVVQRLRQEFGDEAGWTDEQREAVAEAESRLAALPDQITEDPEGPKD